MITYEITNKGYYFNIPKGHKLYDFPTDEMSVNGFYVLVEIKKTDLKKRIFYELAKDFRMFGDSMDDRVCKNFIEQLNKISTQTEPAAVNCHDNCEVCGKVQGQCAC